MNQKLEDIDLLDFILLLWRNKLIIIVFSIIAVLGGSTYIMIDDNNSVEEELFESELAYSVNLLPPKYALHFNVSDWNTSDIDNMLISTYQKLFYTKEVFMNWKNSNKNTNINYDDIKLTANYKGIIVTKNDEEHLATFKTYEDNNYIKVVVDKLPKLNDIFEYANHVSDTITKQHVLSSQIEKNLILKKMEMIENGFSKFYLDNINK